MSAIAKTKLAPEEYLELERKSEERHEYFNGEIFAMSGARRNHSKIAMSVSGLIWQHLRVKDCESYSNDMRVFAPKTGLYTYPDIVVVCGEPMFQDNVFDTLLNPTLLIEVLSDSTKIFIVCPKAGGSRLKTSQLPKCPVKKRTPFPRA